MPNKNIDGYKKLALAIVIKAVTDWRYLCDGGTETRDCNFKELEDFFIHNCDTYLAGTDLSAEKLLDQLQRERRRKIA